MLALSDTIIAAATTPGLSPRAVLRLSGPATEDLLRRALVDPPAMGAAHTAARLRSPDLPCLLLTWRAPRSYTAQDSAELFLPGSPALVERVLARFLDLGARLAGPGEFTARAFLSGKLSLDEAEAVQAMIAARSGDELAAAHRLAAGESGAALSALADDLSAALALVEAGIDFTDQEDVVAITPADLRARLQRLAAALDATLGPRAQERSDIEPIVALVGPPNAGKSTLFNALLGRERTVVSAAAGTTRDAIAEPLELPGGGWSVDRVTLVDLAGLDDALGAHSRVDALSQQAARDAIARADVLILCDPTGRFEAAEPFRSLDVRDRPVLRVRTKADLLRRATAPDAGALSVCALDGWNLGALRRAIADAASSRLSNAAATDALLPRRRRALTLARRALDHALAAVDAPELAAAAMREALDHLGEVTGAVHPDDIIGRVFATFCVGK